MNMKPFLPIPNGLKTTLALGATAIGAATSHAAVVYWDNSGLGYTVTSLPLTDSYDSLSISYDSATSQIALGGNFSQGFPNRGIQIVAEGKDSKWNWNHMDPLGFTLTGWDYTTSVLGTGVSVGTIIDGNTEFPNDQYGPPAIAQVDGSNASFPADADRYVGIRILAGETRGLDYNYGWASISTSADGLSLTLHKIAFESDVNAPITVTASAVPEPGSLVSLSVLLSSAALLRTRRKTAAAV